MGNVYLLPCHFSSGGGRGKMRKSQAQTDSWHGTQDKAQDVPEAFQYECGIPGYLVKTFKAHEIWEEAVSPTCC